FLEEGYAGAFIDRFAQIRRDQERKVGVFMAQVATQIGKQIDRDIKIGNLVYIKSSVLAPLGKIYINDPLKYSVYKYKIYHPSFPHESTADQFFDHVQWESYYLLGQYLGAEVLGVSGLDAYFEKRKVAPDFGIKDLLYRFEHQNADLLTYITASEIEPESIDEDRFIGKSASPEQMTEEVQADAEEIPSDEELTKQQSIQQKVVAGRQIDYTI
ncbi:MAG: hypothetical protein AAGD05_01580, partial [Bacteroidota bacterium]